MKKKPTDIRSQFAPRKSSQHANMRRKNEAALLSLIRQTGGLPSAELARQSGFAPQTVSVLLKGLEEQGIVVRGKALRGRRGQPAVPILLNPEGGYSIGVEVSWRHIDVVLVNMCGHVLAHRHHEMEYLRIDGLMALITGFVEKVIEVLPQEARGKVMGIGLAKPNDMYRHIALFNATEDEVRALEEVDLVGALRDRFEFPVFVGNDGTMACRAECLIGEHLPTGDALYIFIGTYVGSGIYVDGRIIEGDSGEGANIGSSMVPGRDGELHALHFVGSIKALEDRVVAAGKQVPRVEPSLWNWDAIGPEVDAWLDAAAAGLALTIANSCAVIGFTAAVVDGIIPGEILEELVRRVRDRVDALPITTFEVPLIRKGTIGAQAPALGAADMPLHACIFSPEIFEGFPLDRIHTPI